MGRRGTRGGVSAGAFGQHIQRAAKAGYSQAQHQRAPHPGNATRSPATVPVRPEGREAAPSYGGVRALQGDWAGGAGVTTS